MLKVCGEKGILLRCWWECKFVQPVRKKLKIELPYDPAIPLLFIYPNKTIIQKDIGTFVFIAVLFTMVKTWKQSKCPLTNE